MELFTAQQARDLAKAIKEMNLNYERQYILDRVKRVSIYGKPFMTLDEPHIKLLEEDYKFFEDLGYKVTRPEMKWFIPKGSNIQLETNTGYIENTSNKQMIYSYGIISWE